MRQAVLVLAALAVAAVVAAHPARSAPSPNRTLASYCSQTGDLCFGIFKKQGAVFLDISTVERYFDRYRLCVDGPTGPEICRSFPIRRRGAAYFSSVRWYASFPREGRGLYRVTWKLSNRLGPTLRFRLPLV